MYIKIAISVNFLTDPGCVASNILHIPAISILSCTSEATCCPWTGHVPQSVFPCSSCQHYQVLKLAEPEVQLGDLISKENSMVAIWEYVVHFRFENYCAKPFGLNLQHPMETQLFYIGNQWITQAFA